MPAPKNTFKSKITNGDVQIGCWVGMADSYAAEISATAGFDWLLIDGEHAPNDLRSMMQQMQVVQASDSHAVVRLPVGSDWMIKQVLDAGAQSLLIPLVESSDQALEMVRATRYPPHGIRGVGAALARSSQFSAIPDYLQTANDQICLLLQVETVAGIEALDDILAVEGVDGVFIGPADLAADMGHLGNSDAPEVKAAIKDALSRIRAAGKAAGILATGPEFIDRSLKQGANFVAVGIDVIEFANVMRGLAAKYVGR